MRGWAEEVLDTIRVLYPGWDLWVVHVYEPRSTIWCARPTGTPVATINADTPEELIADIRGWEADYPTHSRNC